MVDAPALLAVLGLTVLLLRPVKESATQNAILVAARGAILAVFVGIALLAGRPAALQPVAPHGAGGALAAAGLVFFAFLGFETVSAAAQEAKDPARDVPRAMLWTVGAAAAVYAALALLLLALAPPWLAQVHARHGTPNRMTLLVGGATALSAALLPLGFLVSLTNEANLLFFAAIALAVPLLRRAAPDAPRPFRCPGSPWVPLLAAGACVALVATFPLAIHLGFLAWLGLGTMVFARPRNIQRGALSPPP